MFFNLSLVSMYRIRHLVFLFKGCDLKSLFQQEICKILLRQITPVDFAADFNRKAVTAVKRSVLPDGVIQPEWDIVGNPDDWLHAQEAYM